METETFETSSEAFKIISKLGKKKKEEETKKWY